MLDKKTLRTLYAILILCFALRISLSIYYMDADAPRESLAGVRIAQYLADRKGYTIDSRFGQSEEPGLDIWHATVDRRHATAYEAPVYPAFLGLIYATIGDDVAGVPAHSIVQSVVDTLTCFLVFLFSLRLMNRPKAALVASAMYAVYVPAATAVTDPLPATLAALLATLASYLLMKALGGETGQFRWAGAMMGLLILLKPMMLVFPLVVALMLWTRRRRMQGWIPKAVAYVVLAFLVVSPWTYRNYRIFGALIPVTTQTGSVVWAGTGPADGKCPAAWDAPVRAKSRKKIADARALVVRKETYAAISDLQYQLRQMNEVRMDRTLLREAAREASQHKGRWALLVVKRFFRLWFGLWNDKRATVGACLVALLNAAVLALALLAYRQPKVDYRVKLVVSYLCVYVTVATMLTAGGIRESYPVMPVIIILAATHLGRVFDGGSARSRIVINI